MKTKWNESDNYSKSIIFPTFSKIRSDVVWFYPDEDWFAEDALTTAVSQLYEAQVAYKIISNTPGLHKMGVFYVN